MIGKYSQFLMSHLCANVKAFSVIDKIITEVIKFHGMYYNRVFEH